MTTTVVITWFNPDKNWQLDQVVVGDGESRFEVKVIAPHMTSERAEKYGQWIKSILDFHNRKPGTDERKVTLECYADPTGLRGGVIKSPSFEPNETIRFMKFEVIDENRYLATYEVLE